MLAVGRPPSLYQRRIFFLGIAKAFWNHRHSRWFSLDKKSVSPLFQQRGHKINSILFCTLDKSDQVLAKTAYQRPIWFVKLFAEFVCDHNSKSRNYFARDAPKAPSNVEKDAFAIIFAPKADFGKSVLP